MSSTESTKPKIKIRDLNFTLNLITAHYILVNIQSFKKSCYISFQSIHKKSSIWKAEYSHKEKANSVKEITTTDSDRRNISSLEGKKKSKTLKEQNLFFE